MTIMQLFKSVKIRGYVVIHNGKHINQTFNCCSKYSLDDIGTIYWDKEISQMIVDGNKLIIITKDSRRIQK